MGVYLNSKKSGSVYRKTVQSLYFVDKTAMLEELIPIVEINPAGATSSQSSAKDVRYICITRPRRFGKTVMASMIASFFGKGGDSRAIFEKLAISRHKDFDKHLNTHDVIHIAFNELPDECTTYGQYITRIKQRLLCDLLSLRWQSGKAMPYGMR